MLWTPPTLEDPLLVLPQLQACPIDQWQPIRCSSPTISIKMTDLFVSIWHTPPQNNTDPKELNDRLRVLGNGFSQLIVTGRSKVAVREKSSPTDLVTDMDQGIEMLFRIWINAHYPHHKIVGEEGIKDLFTYDDIVWFIDPIDGTRNFVHGSDDIAVHLGAIYRGRPYACYVSKPFYNQHYTLGDSGPLEITDQKQSVHGQSDQLCIGSEFLSNRKKESLLFNQFLTQFDACPHRKMSIGITLLDTWNGTVDIFYKPRLKPWDAIAPLLLIDADSTSSLVSRYYAPNATKATDYTRLFPLSSETLKVWSDICQNECRVGHFIVGYPQYETQMDSIASAILKPHPGVPYNRV